MIQWIFIFHIVVSDNIKPICECFGVFFPAGIIFTSVRILYGNSVFRDFSHYFFHVFQWQLFIKAAPGGTDCIGDWSAGIKCTCSFCNACGKCIAIIQTSTFRNFISGRPDDNGWMITVPLHKEGEILFPVCIEKLIIVTRPFHNSPGIKSLIVNIHTKPVTDFHQCGRRWIVCCADCIKSNLL